MDIYITGGDVKLRLNALPEQIEVSRRSTKAIYNILDFGEAVRTNGNEPIGISWEAILPGKSRENEPWMHGDWINPKKVIQNIDSWWRNGTKLKLLVTGTPINWWVYIDSFIYKNSGGNGDYHYQIVFYLHRNMEVSVSEKQESKPKPPPKRPTPPKKKTHTVKSGDCLWNIALKYYGKGTEERKIYNANKSIIESTARKYGRSSSNNGWWIYPGTVLVIP